MASGLRRTPLPRRRHRRRLWRQKSRSRATLSTSPPPHSPPPPPPPLPSPPQAHARARWVPQPALATSQTALSSASNVWNRSATRRRVWTMKAQSLYETSQVQGDATTTVRSCCGQGLRGEEAAEAGLREGGKYEQHGHQRLFRCRERDARTLVRVTGMEGKKVHAMSMRVPTLYTVACHANVRASQSGPAPHACWSVDERERASVAVVLTMCSCAGVVLTQSPV
mmetsp:Transcript_11411/g.34004  ORF Transcript_11411/g.34004 Transcript_11411/m.34004 type:complete len:225 (+) Transcript_11411:294-968(+)